MKQNAAISRYSLHSMLAGLHMVLVVCLALSLIMGQLYCFWLVDSLARPCAPVEKIQCELDASAGLKNFDRAEVF